MQTMRQFSEAIYMIDWNLNLNVEASVERFYYDLHDNSLYLVSMSG